MLDRFTILSISLDDEAIVALLGGHNAAETGFVAAEDVLILLKGTLHFLPEGRSWALIS